MQNDFTFFSAGWDFVNENINGSNDYWDICGASYPELAWENVGSCFIASVSSTPLSPFVVIATLALIGFGVYLIKR
jgi:hypothetical protein